MKNLLSKTMCFIVFSALVLLNTSCKKNTDCILPATSGIKISPITTTTAGISWSPISGAINYQVEISDSISNVSLENKLATSTETSFSNLTPDKAYKVKITARCTDNKLSTNAGTSSFRTKKDLCNLPAVTNLSTLATPNSVSATWTGTAGVKYKVDLYSNAVPKTLIQTKTVDIASVNFGSLIPGTTYIIEVAVICTNNITSTNITSKLFKTTIVIDDEVIMFGKDDTKFNNACNLAATSSTKINTPLSQNITNNGIYYIRIKDGSGVEKCAFRLANHLDPTTGIMKFSYKESCLDTKPSSEPQRDAVTNEIRFSFSTATGDNMIVTVTSSSFLVNIPNGYSLFIDQLQW